MACSENDSKLQLQLNKSIGEGNRGTSLLMAHSSQPNQSINACPLQFWYAENFLKILFFPFSFPFRFKFPRKRKLFYYFFFLFFFLLLLLLLHANFTTFPSPQSTC